MPTAKIIVGAVILTILGVAACVVNEVGGTAVEVGEPYKATYTYCNAWSGVGGTRHCSLYLTGTETRVKTEVKGLWWNTESYHVVR